MEVQKHDLRAGDLRFGVLDLAVSGFTGVASGFWMRAVLGAISEDVRKSRHMAIPAACRRSEEPQSSRPKRMTHREAQASRNRTHSPP